MFYFNVSLSNPWSRSTRSDYKTVVEKLIQISQHKFIYFGCRKTPGSFIGISFDLRSIRRSHAGFHASITLFGLFCEIEFYDDRHWDFENNCWMMETP